MDGSDRAASWRSGLLSDEHGMPVMSVRDGLVHEANKPARQLFKGVRPGMEVAELFDKSCHGKLREVLGRSDLAATTELEVNQPGRPPLAVRLLLLGGPGDHLLVAGTHVLRYEEEIGAKLEAANSELVNLTRDLSRRMHDLDCTKRELEKLADLRELFIGALAHDLKSPLSVILLSESMLRGRNPPLQSMEVERHIDKVQRSARRMLLLIDSLLLAARVESGESQMTAESLETVLVDEVAREIADDLLPLAEEARVRIEVTAHERLGVLGNRAWLGQVFANLLTNAIRHSPAGTCVEVAVLAVDGAAVRCEVADQGPGVPVAARGRIFERFVQHGERRGSIGLGLYISSKIVALHGGRIWVEEAPSGGARFVFQIPRASRSGP